MAKYSAFKIYNDPERYEDALLQRDLNVNKRAIYKKSPLAIAREIAAEIDSYSKPLGDDSRSDKFLYPLYARVQHPMDARQTIHEANKSNVYKRTDQPESERGYRGGYSTIGYDPLLPKKEAINHLANILFLMAMDPDAPKQKGSSPMYEVKMDAPVDPAADESLDPQRDFHEEFVSPSVNPFAKRDKHLQMLKQLQELVPEEQEEFSLNLKKKLLKMGFTPRALEHAQDAFETGTYEHGLYEFGTENLQKALDAAYRVQYAAQLARDYYNSKGSVSDEDLKLIQAIS
jgi:hypothetical protein